MQKNIFIIIALFTTLSLYAIPPVYPNLDKLIPASDGIYLVVANGKCNIKMKDMLINKQQASVGIFQSVCTVKAVFEGNCEVNSHVKIRSIAFPGSGFSVISKGDTAIVFLGKEKNGWYEFAKKKGAVIQLPELIQSHSMEGDEIKNKIKNYLFSYLLSKNSKPDVTVEIIRKLKDLKLDIPQELLKEITLKKEIDCKVIALAELIKKEKNNEQYIIQAIKLLLKENLSNSSIAELSVINNSKNTNIIPIDQANKLASNKNLLIREIGVSILRKKGDKTSIPILINALKDEKKPVSLNREIHIQAVWALTNITHLNLHSKEDDGYILKNIEVNRNKWINWWIKNEKNYHP